VNLRIVCAGRTPKPHEARWLEEYLTRAKPFAKIDLVRVRERPSENPERTARRTWEEIEEKIPPQSFRVLLDPKGKLLSTAEFSALFDRAEKTGRKGIAFVVGGSGGRPVGRFPPFPDTADASPPTRAPDPLRADLPRPLLESRRSVPPRFLTPPLLFPCRRARRRGMKHSPGFLKIATEARGHVRELSVDDVAAKMERRERFHMVDVREESEWNQGRIRGAIHLGKGVIERDIETKIPDRNAEIVLYCGGGFRSALAAENLQRMGYGNVYSMDGGWRGWTGKKLPTE
jgi:rhodanese-related sulfurtransferase